MIIFCVLVLTIYNILPTFFYYRNSLREEVGPKKALEVVGDIQKRIAGLEKDNIEWLKAFCKLHNVQPKKMIEKGKEIEIELANEAEAEVIKKYLPRAGAIKPFAPSVLTLVGGQGAIVRVGTRVNGINSDWFSFGQKMTDGNFSKEYQDLVFGRAYGIVGNVVRGGAIGGQVQAIEQNMDNDMAITLAQDLVRFVELFGKDSMALVRYFKSFGIKGNEVLVKCFDIQENRFKRKLGRVKLSKAGKKETSLAYLSRRLETIEKAKAIVKEFEKSFVHEDELIEKEEVMHDLFRSGKFYVGDSNVFVKQLDIDWTKGQLRLVIHPDILNTIDHAQDREKAMSMEQLLMQHVAFLSKQSGERIERDGNTFIVKLSQMNEMRSFLMLDLRKVAQHYVTELKNFLKMHWEHQQDVIICDQFEYNELKDEDKGRALVVYSPLLKRQDNISAFNKASVYIIAKGLAKKIKEANPKKEESSFFIRDFSRLGSLMRTFDNVITYPGNSGGLDSAFQDDFFFEIDQFYSNFLKATREKFKVLGSKEVAILEFSDLEERLLTKNNVETQRHQELLKWKEDYQMAQVDIDSNKRFYVPKPSRSVFWSNLLLSIKKYFRGDNRKILKWGLDLSGGKTVQIELINQNGKVVEKDEEIKLAINELYTRVNKMGVSEVAIHQEGNNVVLDFPGSQNLTAQELITGSSMSFHIVNEKFSRFNEELWVEIDRFLQEVWNEALITNQTDTKSVQRIAWKRLGGYDNQFPISDAARVLKEVGLKLAHPDYGQQSAAFDDTLSQVGVMRGEDVLAWGGQAHPLIILFQNYALQGSELADVASGYDPGSGNYLSFKVKNSVVGRDGVRTSPQDNLYAWTSQFAKTKIQGTLLQKYTNGKQGWRMAVVLNDQVISAPGLEAALSNSGQISGNFTQREIQNLESDLKAGSLTFKPKILSETNVSPHLGKLEKQKGILATVVALLGVIATMCIVYRFGGVVASVAVIFNLLIIWAVYQNLQAALSLAGIAGVILTIGMAVDANVLVFERIREEHRETGKLGHSIKVGYKKAFTAIFDSNLTTILAAFLLLQFDSGPIKGFAVAIIIGIASSMFTALFVTRAFLDKWAQNPKRHVLKMAKLFSYTQFKFIKQAPKILALSMAIILVGLGLLVKQKNSIYGMDFTGGYAITLNLEGNKEARVKVERALEKQGLGQNEFEVRTLDTDSDVRLYLSSKLDQKGKVFHELEAHKVKDGENPKIKWLIDSLQLGGIKVSSQAIESAKQNWVQVSGQLSDTMRNQALYGLALALIGILIYISVRFESRYAIASILCLIHDVFVTLGMISLLRWFGVPLQIDLNTVAAMMTIVGYSLNDTIIVFDRLREDLKKKQTPLKVALDVALNGTLNRTLMTSLTTVVVLVFLVIFGGATIFGFALVMTIGVVFGTLSSLFLAGPALLLLERRSKHTIKA